MPVGLGPFLVNFSGIRFANLMCNMCKFLFDLFDFQIKYNPNILIRANSVTC